MAEAKTQYGILFQDDLRTAVLTGVMQISAAPSAIVTMHLVRLAETTGPERQIMPVTAIVACMQGHPQLQGAHADITTAAVVGSGTVGVTGGEMWVAIPPAVAIESA